MRIVFKSPTRIIVRSGVWTDVAVKVGDADPVDLSELKSGMLFTTDDGARVTVRHLPRKRGRRVRVDVSDPVLWNQVVFTRIRSSL